MVDSGSNATGCRRMGGGVSVLCNGTHGRPGLGVIWMADQYKAHREINGGKYSHV